MLLYTQIENNQAKFPATSIEGLVELDVVDSLTASPAELTAANVVLVAPFTGQAPVDGYEYTVEIRQQSDGSWAQELVKKNISEEQYQNNVARQAQAVKADRDRMIAGTDWLVTKSVEAGTPIPTAWQTYRQALRDIPSQEGFPFNVVWPTRP
jgi:hypothetical protein